MVHMLHIGRPGTMLVARNVGNVGRMKKPQSLSGGLAYCYRDGQEALNSSRYIGRRRQSILPDEVCVVGFDEATRESVIGSLQSGRGFRSDLDAPPRHIPNFSIVVSPRR